MAIRRASKSSISTTSSGKRFNLVAGYSPAVDEMDLIARVVISTASSTVQFTSIPQNYQHLQIRSISRTDGTVRGQTLSFNGVGGTSYSFHGIYGLGGSTQGAEADFNIASMTVCTQTFAADTSNIFASSIVDILDYSLTTKNKVVRSLSGRDQNGAGAILTYCGLFNNTSAITSITISTSSVAGGGNFIAPSTFSLYGVVA